MPTYCVSRYSWMPSDTALPAETAGLHAAEGCGGVADDAEVQADHPGLQRPAHAHRPLEVAGEDIRCQPVLGVVRRGEPSSSVVKVVIGATGPNTSSCRIRAVAGTSASTVGA